MINLFMKLFASGDMESKSARTRGGTAAGVVGIFVNVLLFGAKLFAGIISGSIAIKADAFNNLSDAASSSVTVFGFKLANKPADDEHPFGHGRLEYISSMIVTFLIFIMGFELASSSFSKIVHPQGVIYSNLSAAILIVSILGKLWLGLFYKKVGKKVKSTALEAAATDSFGDMAATGVTLISLILSRFTDIPLDGIFGLGVAAFIFFAGIGIFRDISGPLLGQPPEKEFVDKIEKKIMSYDGIVGIHDLIIHDYGPGRLFGTAHAEVSSSSDIMEIHDTIDLIEQDIKREFDMLTVIHLDPLIIDDERISELHKKIAEILNGIDPELRMHDFRVVEGPSHTNLIFDLVTPHRYKYKAQELTKMVEDELEKLDRKYFAVITVEQSYV